MGIFSGGCRPVYRINGALVERHSCLFPMAKACSQHTNIVAMAMYLASKTGLTSCVVGRQGSSHFLRCSQSLFVVRKRRHDKLTLGYFDRNGPEISGFMRPPKLNGRKFLGSSQAIRRNAVCGVPHDISLRVPRWSGGSRWRIAYYYWPTHLGNSRRAQSKNENNYL